MDVDGVLRNGREVARPVRRHGADIGHRPMRSERGGQMPLAWWAIGGAVFALIAWAIGNTLLRWVTLD